MSEIILHHYPVSHYAEKVRRILAFKKVAWRSVEQPIMMPKPQLLPLTGGYRRIPVLQMGADVYCDSACIVRRIEQLHPEPPVLHPEFTGLAAVIEDWADRRFMWQALLPGFVDLSEFLPADVMEDREKMSPELTKENFFKGAPHALSQALLSMGRLEQMLQHGPYLLGSKFSLADAACYFVLFFMSHSPRVAEPAFARYPRLKGWYERLKAFGPGEGVEMSAADAHAVARSSKPADLAGSEADLQGLAMMESFKLGDSIGIVPDDYGTEEVNGTLARVTMDEIAILRTDPDLGEIAVHFPRNGYRILRR